MNIEAIIKQEVSKALKELYQQEVPVEDVQIKQIPKHLAGDYAVVTFPFAKKIGKRPNEIATALAGQLLQQSQSFEAAEAQGAGFCNLSIGNGYWTNFVQEVVKADKAYGLHPSNGQTVVVEYSSPNTNKPLHLGHIRNNLLGYAMAEVLKAAGYTVKKVQIINDRGVHICKSMLAWERFGNGETPASTGMKGDHLVGKYYVAFEKHFQEEYKLWQQTPAGIEALNAWKAEDKNVKKAEKILEKKRKKALDKATKKGDELPTDAVLDKKYNLHDYFFKEVYKNTYFNKSSELGQAAKTMLQQWEAEDPKVRDLWTTMNGWVYDGFKETYKNLGVDFDKLYYESQTYLVGKDLVQKELAQDDSIFYKKADGSTWIDLNDAKLDEKVVLRSDGTSMYITQDMGTAALRHQDFAMDRMVYVVGNEQDYHFKVLFEILQRLGHDFAKNCHHLSYGMVDLTTGKMKSREGTVVDADNLLDDVTQQVKEASEEREKLDGLSLEEKQQIWKTVALGALKFFILKVESKKRMTFDPQQSIELQGQTGPYIQNAHVRTQSVQRMVEEKGIQIVNYDQYQLSATERDILALIHELPSIIQKAADNYNPADIANYLYDLAKEFHKFWGNTTILDVENPAATSFRLDMSKAVAVALKAAGRLVGIAMPTKM